MISTVISVMRNAMARLLRTINLMLVAVALLPAAVLANDINEQVFAALAQPLPLTGLTQTYQQQPKVVALNWNAAEMLLSLGIQPQAVTSRNGYRKWQSNSPALPVDVVDVGNRAFPSFPLLMQLQPDLIVGYPFRHARISDDLNRIAPTLLLQQFGHIDQPQYRYMQQMRSNYLTLAKQFGKVELAQAQLDDMDVELALLKEKITLAGLAGKRVAYGKFVGMGYGLRVLSTQSLAASVVNDLGLNYAWDTHLPGKDFTHLQLEQIQLLEDTALILVKETQSKGERMTLSPLWAQHAVVQNNDIYYVPALWSFGGPVSVIRMARASLNVFSKLLLMGLFMLALLSVGTFALVPNIDLFDSYQQTYVFQLLLPTLLIAVLSGALLAQSGTVVQVTLGNDFASPSTIGISSGALLGAMLVNLFVTDPSIWMVWIAAFVAAVMIAGLILTLSQVIGGGKLQLILIGMAMSLAVGAVSSAIMLYAEQSMDGLFLWGSGNISQSDGDLAAVILTPALLLLLLPLLCHRHLDILSMGDEIANMTGLKVNRWRVRLLMLAVLQASLVTAMVGVLGFIGLMAPHMAKLLGHYRHREKLIFASVIGALLVIFAELFSRSMPLAGYRLPTGVLTVLLGTPFFLYLLMRKQGLAGMVMQETGFGLRSLIQLPKWLALSLPALALTLTIAYFWPSADGEYFTQWRIVVAVFSGFGLGVAGCTLQALFRNPMASPDISGATSASVLCIILALQVWPDASRLLLFVCALVGAAIVVTILFIAMRYQFNVSQLALLGIAISAWCGTIASMVLTFGVGAASVTVLWLTGTTYGADSQIGILLLAITIPCCLLLFTFSRHLDLFTLGETWGHNLGQPLLKLRMLILLLVVLITAAAVASVGAIAFVGLLSPHLLRLCGQTRHWVLLLGSGAIGAWLLVLADGLGRTLIAPFEIASGILVSIIGGLYFICLILLGYKRPRFKRN